eukprot:m.40833 g.40833  ORF g.40833 m.40833 type:complete len:424 (+) comp14163_c0_seq1:854-2125(+)
MSVVWWVLSTALLGAVMALILSCLFGTLTVRKCIVKLLDLYRRGSLLWLRLRGRTPEGEAEQRIVTGQAWAEFCDTLKAAGAAMVARGAPMDPFNQAEGYRYLSRLARGGLEAFVEFADEKAPELRRMAHETVKLGSDNPDNYYQNARISGEHKYRLYGTRGTVHYLSLGTQIGHYGQGNSGLPPSGFLDEFVVNADGTMEIMVSCQREPGWQNWLPMKPESGMLLVRQTFLDRDTEEIAQLRLERIDGPHQPSNITPQQLDEGLKNASTFVAGASMLFARWANGFQSHTNQLPLFDVETSNKAGGDPNIRYYHSYWRLAPDEALIIEATPPECQHWNFQLNNHWMESLDYRFYTVHTNKHKAKYRADGSVRIVVAHQDPKVDNWITTVGHTQGTMCFRWVRANSHPQPVTRVVKFADITAEE